MKIFFIALILAGCSVKKIEITPEYIVNENWNKRSEEIGANSIEIKKMTVKKDSTINPFSDLKQADILNNLEIDSSFIYSANVKIKPGESYKSKRIYFNRDNDFYWWTNQGDSKTRILGKLEINTWYEISRLNYYYYYVYVDSIDRIHRFVVNLANY
jgi:hypothetical protein